MPAHPQPSPPAVRLPRFEPRSSLAPKADAKSLTSPVPGLIKEVKVEAGQFVQEHTPLLVIETMKMDMIVSSPIEAVIKDIQVQSGQNVQQGEILVTFQ
jgi:3-methylcrotonyl-CoA carboxylase alpha subunit